MIEPSIMQLDVLPKRYPSDEFADDNLDIGIGGGSGRPLLGK